MKKFYSLVLMAAALLIGTNVWANYPATWLQDQFDAIEADGQTHTITMEDDIILTDPVYLGTKTVDEPRKSIILDMNGHHITMSATDWVTSKGNVYCSMFTITHGELLVRNGDKTKTSLIQMIGKGFDYFNTKNERQLAQYNNIFNVAGSYKSSRWQKSGNDYVINESEAKNTRNEGWFTHLEIGEGVKLVAGSEIYGAGISIDGYYTNYHAMISKDATATTGVFDASLQGSFGNVCLYNRSDAPAYNTVVLAGSAGEGVAYGVRVDVYGDIEFATAATEGKAYGIKLNGGLKSSLKAGETFWKKHCWSVDQAYAATYGATSTSPDSYSIGNDAYEAHKLDTVDAPFLYIHSSAHITAASNLNEATAVYCSGYGKTLIEGECKGNSGVNIKSGTVELHDAVITGTATTYSNAQAGNHATGSGGIVVNSVDNRAGGVEVVISGDTKVSTTVGYAIEEVVNTKNGHTDVSSIAIQGGTIEGGNLGAIALTTSGGTATEVTGGNFNGGATIGGNTVDVGTLVPNTGGYHTTEVVVDNKTVIVVSQGNAPTEKTLGEAIADYNAWVAAGKQEADSISVKLTGAISEANGRLEANYEFKELELNATDAQILTVAAGYTFKVGRVVLGENAQIIVEPGATFIVYGSQGIVAPVASNILLKASEAAQATFLFNPAVTSNRHPNATVEVYTNCHQEENEGSTKQFVRQRLAIPVMNGVKPSNNFATIGGSLREGTSFTSYAWQWNGSKWASISSWSALEPFVGYTFSNNSADGGVTYSFAGQLVGNGDATYEFPTGGYDYFGCSHVAPIYVDSLFKHFASNMEATVWVYDFSTSQYKYINAEQIADGFAPEEIKPMEAFVLRIKAQQGTSGMNYKSAIWGNPRFDAVLGRPSQKNNAPARSRVSISNRAIVNVTAENGYADNVTLVEKDTYTTEFDNGADASKLMFAEGINLYATTEAGELARVATDDLLGTLLSFRSGVSTEYTINLTNVLGEDYALRDNVTGQVIAFAEGATYTFMQEANTTVPARFEVISVSKVPTAIDNVEEAAKATGIYTITGQYMGRDFTKLPAGIYIVNGVKVVK